MTPDNRILRIDKNQNSPELQTAYSNLRQRFLSPEVEVKNRDTGFIFAPFMNKQPYDEEAILAQAAILAYLLKSTAPTHIVGIPSSGLYLAGKVTQLFPQAQLVEAVKPDDQKLPAEWDQRKIVSLTAYSFSRQTKIAMYIREINPKGRYLVIDDVSAYGNVATAFVSAIQQRNASVVGFGVGFDKAFQGGLKKVAAVLPASIASVITVIKINADSTLVLA